MRFTPDRVPTQAMLAPSRKRAVAGKTQLDRILDALHYQGPRPRHDYMCLCPAHEDHTPSLSVTMTVEGKILLHCFAGCETRRVVDAIGLTMRDLMPDDYVNIEVRKQHSTRRTTNGVAKPSRREAQKRNLGRIVAMYDYQDEQGNFVCQVVRFEPKSFRQRRKVQGKWVWNIQGVHPPLYHLPELVAADPNALVFVVEGEKDVDALRQRGLVATCNIHGAGKWKAEYGRWLAGRRVCILPDNDEPGRLHALAVAQHLHDVAACVSILALPGLPDKGDVSDWFAQGGDAGELVRLANHTVKGWSRAFCGTQQ